MQQLPVQILGCNGGRVFRHLSRSARTSFWLFLRTTSTCAFGLCSLHDLHSNCNTYWKMALLAPLSVTIYLNPNAAAWNEHKQSVALSATTNCSPMCIASINSKTEIFCRILGQSSIFFFAFELLRYCCNSVVDDSSCLVPALVFHWFPLAAVESSSGISNCNCMVQINVHLLCRSICFWQWLWSCICQRWSSIRIWAFFLSMYLYLSCS